MNILRYELYLDNEPDQQLIEQYKNQMKTILRSDVKFELNLHEQGFLRGKLKFNSSIELEWLLIYGLMELSKLDKNLVIRVHDSDGEILLIEAAEHLPEWLESSKSKNRVFIHQGAVHIIPEEINFNSVAREGARIVRDSSRKSQTDSTKIETLASSAIQEAINEQLQYLPNTKEWLEKKFSLLDEIVSGQKLML